MSPGQRKLFSFRLLGPAPLSRGDCCWLISCWEKLRCAVQLHPIAVVFGFEHTCLVRFGLMGLFRGAKVQLAFLCA